MFAQLFSCIGYSSGIIFGDFIADAAQNIESSTSAQRRTYFYGMIPDKFVMKARVDPRTANLTFRVFLYPSWILYGVQHQFLATPLPN